MFKIFVKASEDIRQNFSTSVALQWIQAG